MKKNKPAGSASQTLNRDKRFELRLSAQELADFIELEQQLGISRADIIRIRVLQNSAKVLVNAKALLLQLDGIGTDLGRSSSSINALAILANDMAEQGLLTEAIAGEFNELLRFYVQTQQDIEKVLRQILRLMKT
jgi:hypothetical protein